MNFRVYTDTAGHYDDYTGKASFQVLPGGGLLVTPDRAGFTSVIYSPVGWLRLDHVTGTSPHDPAY